MDNEPIFTEYELEVRKEREEKSGRFIVAWDMATKRDELDTIILDPATMEFVTPDELKRRDAENIKRLQEISGK